MRKSSKKSRKNIKGGAFLEEHAPRQGRNDEEYANFLNRPLPVQRYHVPLFQYNFPARRDNETAYDYINRMRRRFTRVRESPIDEDYPYSPTPPSPSPTPPTRRRNRTSSAPSREPQEGLQLYVPRQGRNDEDYATFLEGHRVPRFQYTFPARRHNETAYDYINRMRRHFMIRVRESPINEGRKKSLNLALKGKHRRRRASAPSYRKKMSSVKARNWLLHERLKKSRKSKKSKKSKK